MMTFLKDSLVGAAVLGVIFAIIAGAVAVVEAGYKDQVIIVCLVVIFPLFASVIGNMVRNP